MAMSSSDVTAGTNATSTQYNNLRKDAKNGLKNRTTASDGTTVTFDLSQSSVHSVTLGGNRTLALSNETTDQFFVIRLVQDGTGSRTVTWFSTIRWADGVTPTLSTGAGKVDVFGFHVTGSGTYDGFVIGQTL